MQNRNTKLKDNSVVLDWRTRYNSFRESNLFKLADRLFAVQQESRPLLGKSWEHYFPFNASFVKQGGAGLTSFIEVLRYTFHRPRDILSALDILEDLYVKKGLSVQFFKRQQLTSKDFRRAYGSYMLGEIKDSLSFYIDESEFQAFLKFFEYLDGHDKFDYSKFLSAFADFTNFLKAQDKAPPTFMEGAEDFLQFLYDQNIICYIERAQDERFIRWCFLERSMSNMFPKVKTHMEYEIHQGVANALNTGKVISSRRKSGTAVLAPSRSGFFEGTVKFYHAKQIYGFIVQEGMPVDMFFHGSRMLTTSLTQGAKVRFRLEKDKNGRLMAVDVMPVKAG